MYRLARATPGFVSLRRGRGIGRNSRYALPSEQFIHAGQEPGRMPRFQGKVTVDAASKHVQEAIGLLHVEGPLRRKLDQDRPELFAETGDLD